MPGGITNFNQLISQPALIFLLTTKLYRLTKWYTGFYAGGKIGQNSPSFIRGYPVRRALQRKYVYQVDIFITLPHAQLAMGGIHMGFPSSVMASHLPPAPKPYPKQTKTPKQATDKRWATWHSPGRNCSAGDPAEIGLKHAAHLPGD